MVAVIVAVVCRQGLQTLIAEEVMTRLEPLARQPIEGLVFELKVVVMRALFT